MATSAGIQASTINDGSTADAGLEEALNTWLLAHLSVYLGPCEDLRSTGNGLGNAHGLIGKIRRPNSSLDHTGPPEEVFKLQTILHMLRSQQKVGESHWDVPPNSLPTSAPLSPYSGTHSSTPPEPKSLLSGHVATLGSWPCLLHLLTSLGSCFCTVACYPGPV